LEVKKAIDVPRISLLRLCRVAQLSSPWQGRYESSAKAYLWIRTFLTTQKTKSWR